MTWRARPSHDGLVVLLAFLSPLPAVVTALALLWGESHAAKVRVTLTALALLAWIAGVLAIRSRVVRALQSVTNLLSSLRAADFSVRGRPANVTDSLGAVMVEINGLADTLARQRSGAVEAGALLAKVMTEIDVAIFAFDREGVLRMVNRTGERLFSPAGRVVPGTTAAELGMAALLEGDAPRTVNAAFRGADGHWELRRNTFRLDGKPHELVVLTDLRRALRHEERQAWQRLVRVLGHEINNSLAPIRSIASDLQQMLGSAQGERLPDWQEDLARGLAVIERRSAGLDRFMTSYARVARLPAPNFASVEVGPWLRRMVEIEKRAAVELRPGPSLTIPGDGDQLDQLLINLVRNAVEAAQETGGGVVVSWRRLPDALEVLVTDEGPGLAETKNLFVPFFTTKPGGSGIGLVLSRQIVEAHHGALALENRPDRSGCIARLRLPLVR